MMYRRNEKAFEKLTGKTVMSYTLADDGSEMALLCTDGTRAQFFPEGDCCSLSWIEDLDAPDALLGTIQFIEEVEMPNLGNIDGKRHTGVDEVEYYGLKVTTDKGRCVIDYRNDSNGYYGGWLNVYVKEAA